VLKPKYVNYTPNSNPTPKKSHPIMEKATEDIHAIARDYASLMWSSMLNGLEQHPLSVKAYNTVKNYFMENLDLSHDHARKFMFAYIFGHAFFTFRENTTNTDGEYEFDPEAIGPYVVSESTEECHKIQNYFHDILKLPSSSFPDDQLELLSVYIYNMFKEHFSHYTENFHIITIDFTG